jgi:hypothetical protein
MADWSKYVIPVGGVILFYYVLKNIGLIGPVCDPTCTSCPKGSTYSRPLFGNCDANYVNCNWNMDCCCNCCMSLEEMGWAPIPEYELTYLRELVDSL